eukprot:snap_masked-scaffold_3-processed-gene-12.30-mRNA-1 protein AED:1.00 eAED:1.00 QI:0/-1/0/0/-1/1/1/0/288
MLKNSEKDYSKDLHEEELCPSLWSEGEKFDAEKYDSLLFYHSRKAFGSTLRKFFGAVAKEFSLEYKVIEGNLAPNSLKDDKTFYVVNLRDPVSRSISQYKYEGRWSCRQLVRNKTLFVPTLNNQRDFMTWITANVTDEHCIDIDKKQIYLKEHKHSMGQYNTNYKKCGQKVWTCSYDCYLRWFNQGYLTMLNTQKQRETALNNAKSKMHKYDMVVISEQLQNPTIVEQFEGYFHNKVQLRRVSPWCDAESKAANQKLPWEASEKEMEIARDNNKWDSNLYNYFVQGCT